MQKVLQLRPHVFGQPCRHEQIFDQDLHYLLLTHPTVFKIKVQVVKWICSNFRRHMVWSTIFTLSIETPYLLAILDLKFEIVHSVTC